MRVLRFRGDIGKVSALHGCGAVSMENGSGRFETVRCPHLQSSEMSEKNAFLYRSTLEDEDTTLSRNVGIRLFSVIFQKNSKEIKQSFQKAENPRYLGSRHMKVVKLSALRTSRLYPPGNITGTHLFERLSWLLSAAGRMMSMKNSSDIIGNQTRDPPACGDCATACPPRRKE